MSNAWHKLFRQLFGGAEEVATPDPVFGESLDGALQMYRTAIPGFGVRSAEDHVSEYHQFGDKSMRIVLAPERWMERRAALIAQGRQQEVAMVVTYNIPRREYEVMSEATYEDGRGEMHPVYCVRLEPDAVRNTAANTYGGLWSQANAGDDMTIGYAVAAIKEAFRYEPLVTGMPMVGEELEVAGLTARFGRVNMAVRHPAPHRGTISFLLEGEDTDRLPGGRAVIIVARPDSSTHSVTLVREGRARTVHEYRNTSPARNEDGSWLGVESAWEEAKNRLWPILQDEDRSMARRLQEAARSEDHNPYIRMAYEQLRASTAGPSVRYRGPRAGASPALIGDPFAPPTNRRELRGERIMDRLGLEQALAGARIDLLARETQEFVRSLADADAYTRDRKVEPSKPEEPPRDEGISTGRRRIRVRRSAQSEPEQE